MYKQLYCKKCGQTIFDETDVESLVRSVAVGISKSVIDCPHCGYRWGLVVVSDPTGWLTCLMPSEALNIVYQSFQEARNLGAQVSLMSAIMDKLMAKHLEAK
jgi:DNA-directed RNA polymerase subunit RPC12/RpoP